MAHALYRPLSPARRRLLQSLPAGLFPLAAVWGAEPLHPAFALYDQPKYPPDFTHFDYVDPTAPAGGRIVLTPPTVGASFDKLNPFTLKGTAAPGLNTLVFETLMTSSWDEPNTVYGLLADDIAVADDGLSTQFHLNPRARFSNGDPGLQLQHPGERRGRAAVRQHLCRCRRGGCAHAAAGALQVQASQS